MEVIVSVPWFTDSAPVKWLTPESVHAPVPVLMNERAPALLSTSVDWNSFAPV
jgi:hypothetical protein